MSNKLAILISTLVERTGMLDRLRVQLVKQIGNADNVRILTLTDARQQTTGAKRNWLVEEAVSRDFTHACHFDDDDLPGKEYIKWQVAAMNSGCDCGSLWGNIYFSGQRGKPFHHSLKYKEWSEDRYLYKRTPNHLNCIKLDILRQFPFPDQVFGEDGQQSMAMAEAGAIKTEFEIPEVIYHYFTGVKDSEQEKIYVNEITQ